MNKVRVRAIIPLDNGIVFIHRIREVDNEIREYFPLPGGGLEENETIEEGLYREIKEELGLTIKVIKPLYKIIDDISIQHIYLCEYVAGELGTGKGPEFNDIAYSKSGKYLPEIIKLEDLNNTNIVPVELKKQLIADLEQNTLENIDYKEITILNTIAM